MRKFIETFIKQFKCDHKFKFVKTVFSYPGSYPLLCMINDDLYECVSCKKTQIQENYS